MQTRVIIADDHALVREGFRWILHNGEDLLIVGEARDGEEAVQMATALRPDVVLMDISMPRLNGVEATRRIKARLPGTAVLVVTAHDEFPLVASLLKAGATGYLLKTASAEELLGAVRVARAGGTVLTGTISRQVLGPPPRPSRTGGGGATHPLTEREIGVLRLVAEGLSNKAIARELGLSTHTIQVHLNHIYAKLEVGSRTEAAMVCVERGWLNCGLEV